MGPDFSTLWNFADPAESQRRFAQLLGTQTDHADRAATLSQIARAQGLQRRFDEALRTLEQAERELVEADARDDAPQAGAMHARIRIALERGRVLNTGGRPREASPWFERAWNDARACCADALAVDAAHMLGIVEMGDAGAAWNARALELAEQSSDPAARRWTASLRNNIGWWLHDRARFKEALEMFEQARAERAVAGARRPLLTARWAVARCLRSLGRVDEALSEQRALEAEHAQDGTRDGYVYEEIGECLLARGDDTSRAEAREHFQRALDQLAPDGKEHGLDEARVRRWRTLARPDQGLDQSDPS